MTNYQVTFKSHNASNPFILIETDSLSEAEKCFEQSNFDSYFSDDLSDEENDRSEIELRKYVDGEITAFEKNESRLELAGGWIIKEYYAA